MKTICKIFLIMAVGLSGLACQAKAPKGKLIYCSYARTGMAGLGKDYCELIADPDTEPKVNVVLNEGNRFGDREIRAELPASAEDVRALQDWLDKNKVYKLAGYRVDESMSGGHAYRIHMEYDSGEKVSAYWYGHDIKEEALAAYAYISSYFEPWRDLAVRKNEPIAGCSIEAMHTATRAVDACRLLCEPGYVPSVIVNLNVDNIRDDREYHGQYEADPESVRKLQEDLIKLDVYSLGDYANDEFIEGGTRYKVQLFFASGREQTLTWHAREVDGKAEAAYGLIDAFFGPWKAKVREE